MIFTQTFFILKDGEDEAIDERILDQDDDVDENPDAEQDQSLETKVSEPILTEQSSSTSPRLQVAEEEEADEDAADIEAIKEEACQLPDLDLDGDMKSNVEEEKEEEEDDDMPTAADVEATEVTESLSPLASGRGRGGARGRNSGRARRSRGKRS